jgi:hypothetical protein
MTMMIQTKLLLQLWLQPDTDNQDATNVVEGDSSEVDEFSSSTMSKEPEVDQSLANMLPTCKLSSVIVSLVVFLIFRVKQKS